MTKWIGVARRFAHKITRAAGVAVVAIVTSATILSSGGRAMAQSSGQALFIAAEKAAAEGDHVTAREKYIQGLALDPDHVGALVNLGTIYMQEKKYKEAEKSLDHALKLDPNNSVGLNSRALCYLQDGNLNRAIDLFVLAIKANPNDVTPILNIADASLALGDSVNAIKYYDLALKADPTSDHAASKLSELNTGAGLPDKGISLAEEVLARNPKSYEAMVAAGRGYSQKGNWMRAVTFYYEASQGVPRDVDIKFMLGVALMNTKQYGAAADTFLEALDLNDSNPRLHLQLGITYYLMKNKDLLPYAKKEFQHCLDRNPTAEDKALAYYHTALIEDEAGNADAAMKGYQLALKFDGKSVATLNNVGLLVATAGKFKDAIPYYQKALKISPNYIAARFNLGYALIRIGNAKEGKAELQKLMALPDGDPFKLQAKQLIAGPN